VGISKRLCRRRCWCCSPGFRRLDRHRCSIRRGSCLGCSGGSSHLGCSPLSDNSGCSLNGGGVPRAQAAACQALPPVGVRNPGSSTRGSLRFHGQRPPIEGQLQPADKQLRYRSLQ
jgi:hypothetical protein